MQSVEPAFDRSMKTIGCLLIALSCVTPASSVFIVIPGVVQAAGSGALICAIVGGIISLLIAFVYAELGSAFPFAGGEYAMVGRTLGPLAGFVVLGLNMAVLLLGIAVVALGLGTYIRAILPGTDPLTDALVCLLFTTLCALLNVRTNALITGAFLLLELIALVAVALLGFMEPANSWSTMFAFPVFLNAANEMTPLSMAAFGLGTSAAIFAYYGFGSAVYLGEETHEPSRHVARAVILALVIGVISQAVPLAALLRGTPDYLATFRSEAMFSDFVLRRGGAGMAAAMNLAVALAIINANIAIVILAARVLFSTGRDRVWPEAVNAALTKVSPRWQSPWVATLATGALTGLLCLVDFQLLLVMSGTALMVVYGALCLAAIAGRRSGETACGTYRMPFYPWPPIVALLAFAYVIYTNVTDPRTGLLSFWATAAIMILSAIYYRTVLARRGVWILRQPRS
jgi:amino acid transporter